MALVPSWHASGPNLLPASDADNLSIDKSTPSVGSWNNTAAGWTLTVDASGFNGAGRLICTDTSGGAGSAGTQTVETGQVPINSNGYGPIVTATIKTKPSTNNAYNAQVGICFYSDAAGTSAIDGVVHWSPVCTIPASGSWGGWNTLFAQAKVPATAASYRLLVAFSNAVNGRDYYLSCGSVTPGVLNLLDDPSAESGSTGFWGSLGGGTTVIATDSDTATWVGSQKSVDSNRNTSATSRAQMAAFMAGLGVTGADSVFGVDVKSVAGTQVNVGLFDGSGNPVATYLRTTSAAWGRQSGILTGVDNGAGPYSFGVKGHAGTDHIHVDNAQWELVWTIPDGTFESQALGAIPQSCTLGYPASHAWMNAGGSGTAAIDNTHAIGSQSLKINGATAETFFTVSGYTQLEISWWWETTTGVGGTCGLQFFSAAGVMLSTAQLPGQVQYVVLGAIGTGVSFVNVDITGIAVPVGAAYARLFYSNTSGDMYVDSVIMTPTGTLAPSSLWLDGGWSMGGALQTWAGVPPQIYVERMDGVAPWTKLRLPPFPAVSVIAPASDFSETYTDYEFPGGNHGISQTLYYHAWALLANSGSSVAMSPPSQEWLPTAGVGFTVSGANTGYWILLDPLNPSSVIALQVKTAKMDIAANQQTLMPVGRGRKVVIGDTPVFGDTIDLTLQTILVADFIALKALLQSTSTLCLRSPDGEFWYTRFTKRTARSASGRDD